MQKIYFVLVAMLVFGACKPTIDVKENITEVSGYVPVYKQANEVLNVSFLPARATTYAGKVYAYGNYIFQLEEFEGIHVIDNSNNTLPVKVGFIAVPGCKQMSFKNNRAYVNNYTDLVVFDVSAKPLPSLLTRIKQVFSVRWANYPPYNTTYFECVDANKGVVVGWRFKNKINGFCYR